MRSKFLLTLGLVLLVVPGTMQVAWSQLQRYPTYEEAASAIATDLLPLMAERLRLPAYQETRTAQDVEQLQSFTQAWGRVSPNTALFLGEWHGLSQGNDLMVAIYPSNSSPGRVCVLQYLRASNTYQFGVGSLVFNQPQINITGGRDFITSFQKVPGIGEQLAQVTVDPRSDRLYVGGHVAFPRLLRDPKRVVPAAVQGRINLRNYDIAHCTTALPEFRTTALPNFPLHGEETINGVTFRFTGAYVNETAGNRSVVAYWIIENRSDRSFAFYPNRVSVANATGQAIACPTVTSPSQGSEGAQGCARLNVDGSYDPVVEPGQSITGQVTILQRPAALEGWFLILPEASLHQRQFQVPFNFGH